jgi:prevent-host-death family protein
MEKKIGAFEARRTFGKVLRDVGRGDKVVVERNGEPVAAVVPIELYQQWKRRRDAFFEHVQRVSERSTLSEEEAFRLVEEAVAAVRAEDESSA